MPPAHRLDGPTDRVRQTKMGPDWLTNSLQIPAAAMNEPPPAVGGSGQASTVAKKNHPTKKNQRRTYEGQSDSQASQSDVLDRVIQTARCFKSQYKEEEIMAAIKKQEDTGSLTLKQREEYWWERRYACLLDEAAEETRVRIFPE